MVHLKNLSEKPNMQTGNPEITKLLEEEDIIKNDFFLGRIHRRNLIAIKVDNTIVKCPQICLG
ncbi:hypothetical protein NRM5_005520 [Chlamydia psittaci]|nr:hypothetical protein NRM5_005520 [Chlamydia psittaci]